VADREVERQQRVLHDERGGEEEQAVGVGEALGDAEALLGASAAGRIADHGADRGDEQGSEDEEAAERRGHFGSTPFVVRISSFASTGWPLFGALYSLLCETMRRSLWK